MSVLLISLFLTVIVKNISGYSLWAIVYYKKFSSLCGGRDTGQLCPADKWFCNTCGVWECPVALHNSELPWLTDSPIESGSSRWSPGMSFWKTSKMSFSRQALHKQWEAMFFLFLSTFLLLLFFSFYFGLIFELYRSSKVSIESSHMPFTQLPLILTVYVSTERLIKLGN